MSDRRWGNRGPGVSRKRKRDDRYLANPLLSTDQSQILDRCGLNLRTWVEIITNDPSRVCRRDATDFGRNRDLEAGEPEEARMRSGSRSRVV